MKNNKDYFKAKAYGKVIPGLKKLEKDTDLTEENYNKIPGLGKGLKEKIRMIIDTGTCPDYDYILKNKNKTRFERFIYENSWGRSKLC